MKEVYGCTREFLSQDRYGVRRFAKVMWGFGLPGQMVKGCLFKRRFFNVYFPTDMLWGLWPNGGSPVPSPLLAGTLTMS